MWWIPVKVNLMDALEGFMELEKKLQMYSSDI